MARHRIAEVELADFDQLHHRHADKGLGPATEPRRNSRRFGTFDSSR
jgi:hypothetical protein